MRALKYFHIQFLKNVHNKHPDNRNTKFLLTPKTVLGVISWQSPLQSCVNFV